MRISMSADDVFKEEFPATLALLGEVNFHNLITGYLVDYPPTEPCRSFTPAATCPILSVRIL